MSAGPDGLRDFLLRGTYSDTRSLGPEDLAAMRPALPPRPRKARAKMPQRVSAPAEPVTVSVQCFCGRVFEQADAVEFMRHLREEVGDSLEELARIRRWRKATTSSPEYRQRSAARKRERRATEPGFAERLNAAQRERRQRPEVKAARREYEASRRADPQWRERRNAAQQQRRHERAATCKCGCGEKTSGPGVDYKAGHHNRVRPTRTADPARVAEAVRRRDAGETRKAIAAAMGVHPATVGRWLAGARDAPDGG